MHKSSEPNDEGEPLTMSDEDKVENPEAEQETPKVAKTPNVYTFKHLIIAAVVALLVGVGIGGSSVEPEVVKETVEKSDPQAQKRISELAVERDDLKKDLEASTRLLETANGKLTKLEGEAATVAEPKITKTTFSGGHYKVGTDMPAGDYKGTTIGSSGYWTLAADPNGDDYIGSQSTEAQFYLTVKDGQYLELRRVTVTLIE